MKVDTKKAIYGQKMTEKNTLWLIDDDPALRLILEDTFNDAGLNVIVFANAKGAWAKLNDALQKPNDSAALPDVILTDIRMPMMDGLSFSEWVNTHFPNVPIVIMTAHSDLTSAVDSYQTGAFEYLPKPFDLDEAVTVIKKAINTVSADIDSNSDINLDPSTYLTEDKRSDTTPIINKNAGAAIEQTVPIPKNTSQSTPNSSKLKRAPNKPQKNKVTTNNIRIIGQSLPMQAVFRAIGRLSKSPISVLITGESGTGKELVASALHQHSPRSKRPFIALNMAAIPHDLIESELFGHEKGAFTGATTLRQGRFEQADGGTLFLDEIGDMPFSTQTRLLRVLANGEFFRVGGQQPIKVDVRIIAATHQNLEQLVKEGKFREDLFYRLNVIRLPLPPLRARRDDVPELVDFFMHRAAIEMDTEQKQLSEQAMYLMQAFDWPGNVRQLENACRWITVMAIGNVVKTEDLPPELTEFAQQSMTDLVATQFDQESIYHQLASDATGTHTHTQKDIINSSSNSRFLSNAHLPTTQLPATQLAAPSWQQLLTAWAEQALDSGKTDILQTAAPEFERVLLQAALKYTKGRRGEAAELLGWGRNTLTRKIKLLGLDDL